MPFTPEQPKSSFTPDTGSTFSPEEAKYVSPGESPSSGYLSNIKARLQDPERYKAILTGQGPAAPKNVDYGYPPMVMPAGAVPSAVAKLADFLSKTRTARMATGTALGAASEPQEPIQGAAKGLGVAAGGEALGPVLGALVGAGAKGLGALKSAYKYATNPAGYEQELASMLHQGAQNIAQSNATAKSTAVLPQLQGKTASINTAQFKGTSVEPELNRISQALGNKELPESLPVTGPQAQRLKEMAQQAANFKPQPGTLMPTEYPAKSAADKGAASNLRKTVEGIAPDVGPINKDIGDATRVAQAAEKASKNPGTLARDSMQKRALIQKVEELGDVPLQHEVDNLRSAQKIVKHPLTGLPVELSKAALKGGLQGAQTSPEAQTAIQAGLFGSKNKLNQGQ